MTLPEKEEEEIQVVLLPAIQPAFNAWLKNRGLYLFRIPGLSDDDLPTYAIGITQERWDSEIDLMKTCKLCCERGEIDYSHHLKPVKESYHYHGDHDNGLRRVDGPRISCVFCNE